MTPYIIAYLIIAFIHYGFSIAWLEYKFGQIYPKWTNEGLSAICAFVWPWWFLIVIIEVLLFPIIEVLLFPNELEAKFYACGWKLWYKQKEIK